MPTRVQQLKAKLLEKRFGDLTEDYEAVFEELNGASGQKRTQLKRQIESIEQELERVEQELQALEPVRGEIERPDILNLLDLGDPAIASKVTQAYWACLPEDWPNRSVPGIMEGIVAELERIPLGSSNYPIFARFLACLVADPGLPLSVSQPLQTWAEQQEETFPELLNQAKQTPRSGGNATTSHLMVAIWSSNQHAVANPNQEKRYFVAAWVVPDAQHYKVSSGLGCEQLSLPDSLGETVTFDEMPALLKHFLAESSQYLSPGNLTIEIFLPLDLLNQAVDSWPVAEREWELQLPVPLGCQYTVLVRSHDRLLPTYQRYRGFWQQKWERLQQWQGAACEAFVAGECEDFSEAFGYGLYRDLRAPDIVGLKCSRMPSSIGEKGIFAIILQTAIPVALWARRNLTGLNCCDEIDRVLACCLRELPAIVTDKRLDACGCDRDSHIGHHLSLLWENPDRVPPTIDYGME